MDILETEAYYRRQRRKMSCAVLLSFCPFLLACAAFFYLSTPRSPPSVLMATAKSAPALLLAAAVLTWNGRASVAGGLIFSAGGDFCLVWPHLFLHGMVAFAVAHLLYSLTFLSSRYEKHSSSSCMFLIYLLLLATGAAFFIHLYPFLQKDANPGVLVPGVGVYVVLITLMGILAVRTRHPITVLGSLSFIVSDMSLALLQFKVIPPVEDGHTVVMVTYYLAQLLIGVGDVMAVEQEDDFAKWKRS
ncbi:lysoplasmalogenase [Nerophis ophidion]|uniref:lysoplasmalogenase n=1 Tax=Nerophis ophidion TaxID=159077 RepID=UPI002ADF1029|nr:lysoplasmalogenase [Nerophis ophidion]XP_061740701.1 lysoplasmalogenase [Nerophis ophidion]XP_061740702.1 lysoplasmalogenase [Nerophis ophidion]XP_061740703.1 lysoplasmalogenase [Nerophis ophidion]XP_061740704.1 lysoplasmalogenase [Nerophis ophidion]